MIKEEVQKLLNNLIQLENLSSSIYLAMSADANRKNYTGMAHWLKLQSDEERTHMLKLIDYLAGKDGIVQILAIPAQPTDFGTPLETFGKALEHERFVTNAYRRAYDYITQVDSQTLIIILDFLREQIEEENQTLTIVERLKIATDNPAALLLLDQELGQRKNGGAVEANG
ncbi:ferritin [Bacillus mycoides]|uniref:ferritin n=1 Tax=Bacillus mycoides TaxID=1405 RepID=UPI003D64ED60